MDGNMSMEMSTLAKQVEENKTQEKQQEMRTHLTGLQDWDLAAGQTIEERRAEHAGLLIQQQKEYNQSLVKKSRWKWPFSKASKTAEGQPAQTQAPAKKTYKQKKEDKRLDQVAKEKNPVADHISYHMVEGLKEEQSARENSIATLPRELRNQAGREKVDKRVLGIFVHGHQVNQNGEPASEEDAAYRAADLQFLEDYISKDVERRRPHLDRMMEQALSVNVTPELLTPDYMEYHAGEVHKALNTLVYFENVYHDPVNKPYFDALPQLTRDLIESRVLTRYAQLGAVRVHICATKGVDADGCSFSNEVRDEGNVNTYKELAEQEELLLRAVQDESQTLEQEAVQRDLEQQMAEKRTELMQGAQQMKTMAETMEGDIGGLGLTGFVTGYSFDELSKYRKMIEDNSQAYEANPQLIDALYQGMHHAMDALGDVTLRSMSAQGVIDDANAHPGNLTATERVRIKAAGQVQEQAGVEADLIRERLTAHADALQAVLQGKKFSNSAKALLHQMGHRA